MASVAVEAGNRQSSGHLSHVCQPLTSEAQASWQMLAVICVHVQAHLSALSPDHQAVSMIKQDEADETHFSAAQMLGNFLDCPLK